MSRGDKMDEVQSATPEKASLSFLGLVAGVYIVASVISQIMSNITFLYETHTFKALSAGLLTQAPGLRWLGEGLDVPFHAVASLYATAAHYLFGGLPFVVPYELSELSLTVIVLVNLFLVIFLRFYGRPHQRGFLFWALAVSIVCLSLYALDGLFYQSVSWASIAFVLIFISNYILMLLVARYGTVSAVPRQGKSAVLSNMGAVVCLIFLVSTTLVILSVWHSYSEAGMLLP